MCLEGETEAGLHLMWVGTTEPWCHPAPSSLSWPPVIEEANWMTLDKDVPQPPGGGFDAVICLGNSFAHLPDCKGERECGLENGPCFELFPAFTDPWVPALLLKQTLLFAPLCLGTGTSG